MIKKRSIYILIFLLSVLLQGISILQYFWKNEEQHIINWVSQYIIIVIASILFTSIQYIITNNKYRYILFILRFVLILIIHFPVTIYIGLKQMFIFSFLLDLSFLIAFPINTILSVLSFLIVYFISSVSQYWAMKIPLPELHDILYISIYSFLAIFIFSLFKYFYDSYTATENQINRLNQTINKLTDANTGFQHYIQVVEKKSTKEERNRIIREIHDSIGYTLTTVMMLSTSILESQKGNPEFKLKETLEEINNSAKSGLNDMRIVLRILKIKKENKESDLSQLNQMVKAFEKATNLEVRLNFTNIPINFSDEISHLVFRLIQEGMINALRHGLASLVEIFLFIDNDNLIITISDNGKGFKNLSPGIGLKGIKERLEKINGSFSITNSTMGVTLRIILPMGKV